MKYQFILLNRVNNGEVGNMHVGSLTLHFVQRFEPKELFQNVCELKRLKIITNYTKLKGGGPAPARRPRFHSI